jgi:hypothetical protein
MAVSAWVEFIDFSGVLRRAEAGMACAIYVGGDAGRSGERQDFSIAAIENADSMAVKKFQPVCKRKDETYDCIDSLESVPRNGRHATADVLAV